MILVQRGIHLFDITIGAVTIQGDGEMLDEFAQTGLVVPSNMFLGVAARATHTATLTPCVSAIDGYLSFELVLCAVDE